MPLKKKVVKPPIKKKKARGIAIKRSRPTIRATGGTSEKVDNNKEAAPENDGDQKKAATKGALISTKRTEEEEESEVASKPAAASLEAASAATGESSSSAPEEATEPSKEAAAAVESSPAPPVPAPAPAQPSGSSHKPSVAGSVLEAIDEVLGNKYLIRIRNISSTGDLGVKLDLKKIALKCRNTEYNPRKFGAVIMRINEPKSTALIFSTGKMCVTGVTSTHNAALATKKFAYIVERVGFKPQEFIDFKVRNLTGTVDCGFPIRLEGLVHKHCDFASYEPELFPGLIYRMAGPKQGPRVVFLIFVSGKIVITGARKETDLSESFIRIYPVLYEFKKEHVVDIPGLAIQQQQQQQQQQRTDIATTAGDAENTTTTTTTATTTTAAVTTSKIVTADSSAAAQKKKSSSVNKSSEKEDEENEDADKGDSPRRVEYV